MAKQAVLDAKTIVARLRPLLAKLPARDRPKPNALEDAILDLRVFAKDLESGTDELLVFSGDLTVKGSFTFGTTTFVLGNLVVNGVLREHWHGAHLVVGGSIKARGIKCGSSIHAGGTIETEALFVETAATIGSGSGIEAALVIAESRSPRTIKGEVNATMTVDLAYPDPKPVERLRSILTKQAFGVVGGDAALFSYVELMETIRKKKPWLQGAGARNSQKERPRNAPKPVTPSKAGRPRYFEFVDASSRKFWEISTKGASLTTRYGRIGTDGQTTKKTFASPAEARSAAEKLTRAKARKGYVEKD